MCFPVKYSHHTIPRGMLSPQPSQRQHGVTGRGLRGTLQELIVSLYVTQDKNGWLNETLTSITPELMLSTL